MAKKIFTDESLQTFVDEIKSYTDNETSKKANVAHTHDLTDVTSTNAPWEVINGSNLEDLLMSVDSVIADKADQAHTHTITASASDDDVVILTGTNGTNQVTYSASHANSGVTAGTYKSVTVNAKGHVTGGSNPTTLSGYGITDALSSSTKYALADSAGGKALNMKITRVGEDIKAIAGKVPIGTEVIYFCGSDGLTLGCPKTYCIINIKKGDNHRTIMDCYHLETGDHYINGCMHADGVDDVWTGWVLQPNQASLDTVLASAKTYTDTVASGKANSSHTHDDRYYTEAEIDTKLSGKADKTHAHAIADVSGLQSALDGKAATSHGTHVSYSTTAPVMDGTASAGSASTVARSDHKHPTDTSRASKTEFDTHTSNTTVHITSDERTNWNAAKTTADAAKTRADSAYTLAEGKVSPSALSSYYTKTEIDDYEFITVADIDNICSTTISVATASEVTF